MGWSAPASKTAIMGCCELVRQARRNGSQQVVAARRRAQQQQQPCALQVLERGQVGEQLLVLVPLRCQDSRNELPASNRAAQHDQTLFSRRQGQLPVQQGGSPSADGSAARSPAGSSPAAFQARVFPRCTWTLARRDNDVCAARKAGSVRSGRDVM